MGSRDGPSDSCRTLIRRWPAQEIGYPVVVKVMVGGVVHKTEQGLVRVGLRSDVELRAEAEAMLERARAAGGPVLGLLVQHMLRPGAELLVGGRVDPDFGPVVVVGGGMPVELYKDAAVRSWPRCRRRRRGK